MVGPQKGYPGILLALGIGLLSLSGCGGGDAEQKESSEQTIPPPSEGVVTHPVEERIPYHDREAIQITKDQTIEALSDPPASLQVLASWLQEPQSIDTTPLGFFIKRMGTFDIASIGSERLVLFNGHEGNRLFEHSVDTGETIKIAEEGSGPGELQFAYDLVRDGRSIYVARQDRRVDRFDCHPTPCEYAETIRVPIQAMSVARRPQGLAVLAHPSVGGEGKGKTVDEMSGVIHFVDSKGTVRGAFGAVYLSTRFMVLGKYTRSSELAYSGRYDKYALAAKSLPYLWMYDADGRIDSVFEITEFGVPEYRYDPENRSISVDISDSWSDSINKASILEDRFLILMVQRRGEDARQVLYYAVDLKTSEPYFLGTDTYGEDTDARAFFTTDHHQVLVENGAVALVE